LTFAEWRLEKIDRMGLARLLQLYQAEYDRYLSRK
jgi:hypothetical protein